jgi:hypothetical protein
MCDGYVEMSSLRKVGLGVIMSEFLENPILYTRSHRRVLQADPSVSSGKFIVHFS